MRSLIFNTAYAVISVFYALWAALAALSPRPDGVRRVIARYVRTMTWAMRVLAGISIEVRGRERLPAGPCILAPKHGSYGDGFSIYAQFDDLAFVTGDHLERFPLLKTVLRKLGAIVVDNCGGPEARRALSASAAQAHAENRRILIYPEGHLAPVGVYFRYRAGVYHMARDFGVPVVPVASSLGLFWRQDEWTKHPGRAVLEFLDPIEPGPDKAAFLARLQEAVETRTAALVAEARGGPIVPSVLGRPEAERAPRSSARLQPDAAQ